jgi:drug/metabolite transporter (DMT)-like permease
VPGRTAPAAVPPAVTAMVVATLLWGATFVVIRDSLAGLSPGTLVAVRFGVAAVVLGGIAVARGVRLSTVAGPATLKAGIVGGLAAAGGYLFQAIGLTSTRAGSSAFLTSTGTLFAALFAWPLLGQRPGGRLVLGIGIALIGSALLGVRGDFTIGAGDAWTLLGALCFALQVVALARWAKDGDAVSIAALQAAVAALCVLPTASHSGAQLAALDGLGWARLTYLIAAGSVVAPLLQVYAQRTLSPGRIGLLFALEPVFALLFALAFGGERFVARWWAGAALILFSVVGVEWGEARRSAATIPTATA